MNNALEICEASLDDAGQIAEIFSHYVLESTASFETEPPDRDAMAARMEATMAQGYPWLVVRDDDGRVLGYAHAQSFGDRTGYAYSCETSIYVRADSVGKGVGTRLINALVEACEECGYRQAFAVIAGTEPASVVLHARASYFPVGTLAAAGWKHGKWIDVFIMQRKLGPGADTLPEGEG
ncbi:phosphinothricin acetyltransferase [Novosphingobium sp. PC22D]|uniref:GNAT family N-acetyltransferase n=1 Tax=Novosphingobium sp. PC22D TaxID=1962403 RepID=UPI000BF064A4|nr:GNAT family N-acetyltransferase [Novosphingobium sp. PC22D]PEQ14420.1 phosphinothricin acetyltransferase [Novosphingobium sp. PC22D]